MALLDELTVLEKRLVALGLECDRTCAEALLTPDFREFGGSGRVLDRAAVLNEIGDAPARRFQLTDLQCKVLSADAALLSYQAVVDERRSIRSSVWVRRNGRWQMLFHQGTRMPA